MSQPDFESVLDRCLNDVLSGRRSIESCLEEWPQFIDRLGPALRTATALRSSGDVIGGPERARRTELMAKISTTPQDRPRRWRLPRPRVISLRSRMILLAPATAIAAAMLVLVLLRPFGTQPVAEAAVLTTFGDVERVQDGQWSPASDNDRVHEGDRLRTAPDGSAVLTFTDGTTITLDPSTEVILERNNRDGQRLLELRQLKGRVWSNVLAEQGSSYRLHTTHATVLALSATAFETAVDDGETTVNAPQGNIEVQTKDDRVLPAPGEVIRARIGQRLARAVAESSDRIVTVLVDGPFAASLISPRGLATGARPDGALYRQIPGTLTTSPAGGDQRISLLVPIDGTYTLLLRRVDEGTGAVVVKTSAASHPIEVPTTADAMSIRLHVSETRGAVTVQIEDATPVAPDRIDRLERIVLTPGIRQRVIDALRDRRRQSAAPSRTAVPR